ncbi:MAG: DegT/DnrJ/EryC1/StrS aminotransferase [Candidatus Roizmanbacteria bacterium GW2011_GWA2_35_19]|uniref:DegT/DnrJ/EryC1/StrS aminotransferase n=2 Tax=Candidatus Roizmaniibacteriota TaxID=1752723 RepID=A0A0G0BRP5_9BACT|nr:MAG: DegT/DnrJ/EryC1/StrS aminotransferase [Candidatus Roizmanbacteria bacterium GW2011_GWC2_35_12]KKP72073.1 MAG: DegT/DnrJ/EryC1/StrS aminotransferase [Candidatus Roizmanbacteria bacterium GW2011_GWA2_35_19]
MDSIFVTKSFLPPISEFNKYLDRIWKSSYLTNQGPLLKEFEEKIKKYLDVENFHFVTNGTIALQIALRALDITEGEVITTPFSYVATTSSILWERCTPVFVDIEPNTFCIDANKIEKSITKNTKAIMAVHVFGYPCNVKKINKIATKYNLKVIYDAAHAFGVKYKGKSLLDYGDVSICSFHATKVFHTIEGGCLVAKSKTTSNKIDLIKRFGHYGDEHFSLGINGKASEFQAAMGLCNIKYVDQIIKKRKKIFSFYDKFLKGKFKRPKINKDSEYNYSYYPILFQHENQLLRGVKELNKNNIFPRRYFYPSLNKLPYVESKQSCPVSENIASKILCLPLFTELDINKVRIICDILTKIE